VQSVRHHRLNSLYMDCVVSPYEHYKRWKLNPNITGLESRLQPDQACLAGCRCLGRYPPAKAGTPDGISGLFFKIHQVVCANRLKAALQNIGLRVQV